MELLHGVDLLRVNTGPEYCRAVLTHEGHQLINAKYQISQLAFYPFVIVMLIMDSWGNVLPNRQELNLEN